VKFKPLLKIDIGDASHTLSVRYTVTFLCLFCPLGVFLLYSRSDVCF